MRPHRHSGLTLVEVLLALLLLATGVVAASGAQLAAGQARRHAHLLAQAQLIATSLAERIAANAALATVPDTSNPYAGFAYDAAVEGAPAGAPDCHGTAHCTPHMLAAFDLYETAAALSQLPGGRIAVCRDAAPWDAAREQWRWPCTGAAGHVPLVIKIGWRAHADAPALVQLVAQ